MKGTFFYPVQIWELLFCNLNHMAQSSLYFLILNMYSTGCMLAQGVNKWWKNNNVLHGAITWQLVIISGTISCEIIHTLCTTYHAMCIDSVWHCTIIYSTMCYASRVAAWLHHSYWFIVPLSSGEVKWKRPIAQQNFYSISHLLGKMTG